MIETLKKLVALLLAENEHLKASKGGTKGRQTVHSIELEHKVYQVADHRTTRIEVTEGGFLIVGDPRVSNVLIGYNEVKSIVLN